MRTSEKGFGVIEILIVLAVIGLIGGVSWYVWQNNNDEQSANQTVGDPTEDNESENDVNQEPYTYTFDELGISMDILGGWEVTTNHTEEQGVNFYEWIVEKPESDGEIRLGSSGFQGGFHGCDEFNPLNSATVNDVASTQNPDLLFMSWSYDSGDETRNRTSIVPASEKVFTAVNDSAVSPIENKDVEKGEYFFCLSEPQAGFSLELNDEPAPSFTRVDSISARASNKPDNQFVALPLDAESYEDIKTMLTSIN